MCIGRKKLINVVFLSGFLILVILSFAGIQDEGEAQTRFTFSLTEIRDKYTRLTVEKGSELINTSKEVLQMSIFSYLMAQRKLSDLRAAGYSVNSRKYNAALFYFDNALNNMKIAKSNWELQAGMAPSFSYSLENKPTSSIISRLNKLNIDSILPSLNKNYDGRRGIDFPVETPPELDPIYSKPTQCKKLNKEIIDNLNLGFKFADLPPKLIKTINEREAKNKQTRFNTRKDKNRIRSKPIPPFGNLNINPRSFDPESNFPEFQQMYGRHISPDSNINSILGEIGQKLKTTPQKQFNNRTKINLTRKLDLLSKNRVFFEKNYLKNLEKKKPKLKRSKGALEKGPDLPSEVASQIEEKLGGPLKYIDIDAANLSENKSLKKIYMDYINSTLVCLKLYKSKPIFEDLFKCSKKQLELSIQVLEIVKRLKINYSYQKNDVSQIMKKFGIKYIKYPETPDYTTESQEFLNLLIENNIFNHKNQTKSEPTSDKIDPQLLMFSREPKPIATIISERAKYIPSYLNKYMERFKFTKEEYSTDLMLSNIIDMLALIESNIVNTTGRNIPINYNEIYDYKMLIDSIPAELCRIRTRKTKFSETSCRC
ncbi:hypothetical protein HWI79_3767 [Cryptosporidium felis]|nr:hypothetical protein HWI79_3767 [Cryptosporidium felis]